MMKYATIIIFTVLIGLFIPGRLMAQNIDSERMSRDLRVSESILSELFTLHVSKNKKLGIIYFGDNSDEVNGTYIPNYGALFVVQGQVPNVIPQFISINQDSSFYFKLVDEDKNKKSPITKETIISRIQHFILSYGATIGQLKPDSRITIIYQANSGMNGMTFIRLNASTKQTIDGKMIPNEISVSVKKSDLTAFNKGSISKKQLNSRLRISTSKNADLRHNDIRVMAKIVKTVFQDDQQKFNISGPVNHLYVKGLGALFFIDASYGARFLNDEWLQVSKAIKAMAVSDTTNTHVRVTRTWDQPTGKLMTKKQIKEEFKQFLNQLKQTLVDYGRTINSIDSDEGVFLMVNIGRVGYLPDRVELQISRSDLWDYGQGKISRKQAINKVAVRKY